MNLNIGNEKVNNINTVSSTVQSSTVQASSTSSAPIKMVDEEKNKLCKNLGITIDEYDAIIAKNPTFKTANLGEQQEIVKAYKSEVAAKAQATTTPQQNEEKPAETATETQSVESNPYTYANKAEYNKKDVKGKIEDCYAELAKNIYIHGATLGKVSLPAHSAEEWAKLSDAQKQAEVEKLKQFIDTVPELKTLKAQFNTKVQGKGQEALVDAVMDMIQTANTTYSEDDKVGMAFTDFIKLDEYDRAERIENYLSFENASNLNENDKKFLARTEMLKKQVASKISEIQKKAAAKAGKDAPDPINPEQLDTSDIAKYMKYYNLNENELLYKGFSEKAGFKLENLSNEDQEAYKNFEKLNKNPSAQKQIQNAKAKNALALKSEYDAIKAKIQKGEEVSSNEQGKLSILEEYLNSEEGKLALKNAENLPTPKTDYEKSVVKDYETISTQLNGVAHGSDIKSVAMVSAIEQKIDGMSKEDAVKYITTFINMNSAAEGPAITLAFVNKYPELLDDKNLIDSNALNADELNTEQYQRFSKATLDAANSGSKEDIAAAQRAVATSAQVLKMPHCKGAEHDDKKAITTTVMSQISPAEDLKYGADMVVTMTDAEKAKIGMYNISNAKNANAGTQIHIMDVAKNGPEGAGAYFVAIAGQNSPEAAAYAAENGIIAQLSAKDQTEALVATRANIEKHFKGQKAIQYSNSLADQIQNCDKNNQLAMHNEMLNSKYSEVQEHVAGNIKNYDVSVQSKAIESIVATGNVKATEVAVANLCTAPQVVQDGANLKGILNSAYPENPIADTAKSEIQQKIASGAKLTPQEYFSLSDREKTEYKANFFKSLPAAKQIAMLSSLTDVTLKKTIFKRLVSQDKNFFRSLVESDANTATFAYDMHIGEEIVMEVAKRKAASDIKFALLSQKIDADYEKKNSPLASTENNFSRNYTTDPNGFKFDPKELFKLDKNGNILA